MIIMSSSQRCTQVINPISRVGYNVIQGASNYDNVFFIHVLCGKFTVLV